MPPARPVPWRLKYRPGSMDEFVDQDEVKGVLLRALASNQLDNWLFTGAPGLGKTALARLFIAEYARRFGLTTPAGGPDPAFFKLVELTSETANVQAVADLTQFAKFLMSQEAEEKGAFRIIVLDEIDRFSGKAMEDLRKLLEGQSAWAGRMVVIATTNYPDRLPEAIRSRFRTFEFHRPPLEAMVRRLKDVAAAEGCTVSDADVTAIAQDADGSLRQGLVLLQEKCLGSLPPGEIPGGVLRSPVEEQERADAALLAMLEFPVRVPNEKELEAVLALIRRRSGVKEAKTYLYRGSRYDAERFKAFLAGMAGRKSNVARVIQETTAKPPEAPAGMLSFFGAAEAAPPARPAPIGERTPPTLKAQGVLPVGPSRVAFDRSSAESALNAARRLQSDKDLYIYAVHKGFIIEHEPPPFGQHTYTVVHPDGSFEVVEPKFGEEAYRAIAIKGNYAREDSQTYPTFAEASIRAHTLASQFPGYTPWVREEGIGKEGALREVGPPPPEVALDTDRAISLARNWFGALNPSLRRRLELVLAAPSDATWDDTHGIILSTQPGTGLGLTLWKAVLAVDPSFPARGPTHDLEGRITPWPKVPDRDTLTRAIYYATSGRLGVSSAEIAAFVAAPPAPAPVPLPPPFPWPEWRWPVPWPQGSEKDHGPNEYRGRAQVAFDLSMQDFWVPLITKALGHAPDDEPGNPIGLVVSKEDWDFLRTRFFRDSSTLPAWATDITPLGTQVEVLVPGDVKALVRDELVRRLGREPYVKYARWLIHIERDWPLVRDLFLPWPSIVQRHGLPIPDVGALPEMVAPPPREQAPARFREGDFVFHKGRILHVKTVTWNGSDWEYVGSLNGTPDFRIAQGTLVGALPGPPAIPREAVEAAVAPTPPEPEVPEEFREFAAERAEEEALEEEVPPRPESLILPPDVDALPGVVKASLKTAGYRLEDITVVAPAPEGAGPYLLVLRDRWGGTANVQVGPAGQILAAFEVGREVPYHKRGQEPAPAPAPKVVLGVPPPYPAQKEMVRAALEKRIGLEIAPTGTGKTLVALAIWERLGRPRMLWATPTRALLEEVVRKRFPEVGIDPSSIGVWYGDEHRPGPLTVAVYDSLAIDPTFITGRDWPLIILDEADVLQDPSFVEKILPALLAAHGKGSVVIGLTATPPKRPLAAQVFATLPLIFELEHERAVAEGLLAPADVEWVRASLSPEEDVAYSEAQQRVVKASHAIPGGPSRWAQLANTNDPRAGVAKAGLKGRSDRETIVSLADQKLDLAVELIKDLPGERVLAFSLRVDSIEELCGRLKAEGVGCVAVTSKTPREQRQGIVDRWGKDFQVLSSVHVLERGINVPEARVAVLISGGVGRMGERGRGRPRKGEEVEFDLRQVIQRIGRVLRPQAGKRAVVYVLYVPYTVDSLMVQSVATYLKATPPADAGVAPPEAEEAVPAEEAEAPEEEVPPPPGPVPAGVTAAPAAPPPSPTPPTAPAEVFGDFVVVPSVVAELVWVQDQLSGTKTTEKPMGRARALELARTLADIRQRGYESGARVLAGKVLEPTGQTAGGFKRFRLREGPPSAGAPPPPAPPTPPVSVAPATFGDFEVRRYVGKWRIWDAANEQWSGGVPPDVDGPPIRAPITASVEEANGVARLLAEHRLDRATKDPLFATYFEPSGRSVGGFMTYQRAGVGALPEPPAPAPPALAPPPPPAAPAARLELVPAPAPPAPVAAPGAPGVAGAGPPTVVRERPVSPTPLFGNYAVLNFGGSTWMVQDLLTNSTVGWLDSEEAARNQAAALAAARDQNYLTDPGLRAMMVPSGESPGGHRAFRFGR